MTSDEQEPTSDPNQNPLSYIELTYTDDIDDISHTSHTAAENVYRMLLTPLASFEKSGKYRLLTMEENVKVQNKDVFSLFFNRKSEAGYSKASNGSSVKDLDFRNDGGAYIFRGEWMEYDHITPSLYRPTATGLVKTILAAATPSALSSVGSIRNDERLQAEYLILREFHSMCNRHGLSIDDHRYFENHSYEQFNEEIYGERENTKNTLYDWLPKELEETAGLAQHYGLPTRMVDWSYDLLAALFFACDGVRQDMEKKYENMERAAPEGYQQPSQPEGCMVVWALNLANVRSDPSCGIRICEPPYAHNPNLSAQKGLLAYYTGNYTFDYTFEDDKTTSLPDKIFEERLKIPGGSLPTLIKIRIPQNCYKELFGYLNAMGRGNASIYPDFTGVADELKARRALLKYDA